jgi:2-dehydro-3-deoxygluconokinase
MPTPHVWTVGEAMAALVAPTTGPAEHATHLNVGIGGAELNVAIALSRLGHPVTWVGVVGDDPWGRRIVRELRAEGVRPEARTTREAFTGAYLRERRVKGLARVTYLRRGSAASRLETSDIDRMKVARGDIVHLTGVTPPLSESARKAWLAAAHRAHTRGATVSLDVNYRSALWTPDEARGAFDEIAALVDIVMASPEEADVICGSEGHDALSAAAAVQAKMRPGAEVIIKDGADGSLHLAADGALTRGTSVSVAVQDLVGAGDAFAAGFLSALLDGAPVADRLTRGHTCAAFVVATNGDWEGAPRRTELALAGALAKGDVHR